MHPEAESPLFLHAPPSAKLRGVGGEKWQRRACTRDDADFFSKLLGLMVPALLLTACPETVTPADGGGSGGAGGSSEALPSCPASDDRWGMVLIPNGDRGYFCIDSREATNAQYEEFLESGALPDAIPECDAVEDMTPKAEWPYAPGRERYPVVAITWCQADAFCKAGGRRLCGRASTNAFWRLGPDEKWTEVDHDSEMYVACSESGKRAYVYGDDPEPGRCNDTSIDLVPADSETTCEGGYDGVFFLQGNAREWEGICSFEQGKTNFPECFMRGTPYNDSGCLALAVATGMEEGGVHDWAIGIGVRCCADVVPSD